MAGYTRSHRIARFYDDAVKNRPTLFLPTQTNGAVSPGLALMIACALLNAWLLVSYR